MIQRIINVIGNTFTLFGFSVFVSGMIYGGADLIEIGLLSMILGELIN